MHNHTNAHVNTLTTSDKLLTIGLALIVIAYLVWNLITSSIASHQAFAKFEAEQRYRHEECTLIATNTWVPTADLENAERIYQEQHPQEYTIN